MTNHSALDTLCINTIRTLAIDAIQKANSGHPGMPMGAAPMAYILWDRFLKHDPAHPDWPDRDRFVLSAGHASMLLYSLLHLTGYDLPLDEIQRFRRLGSKTPGHPEHGLTPGVETTTGPLGQGFANGVGLAIAEVHLAARFNQPGHEIVDHMTYGIISDGDLMEGVSAEAASLAGHLKLGKMIYLYDDNHITIDGETALTFTEDRLQRFAAYGWHVQSVADGNDLAAIAAALQAARAETTRPSLIAVKTVIGFGSPNRQGKAKAHGEPLGADEVKLAKQAYNWPVDRQFEVPDEVRRHMQEARQRGRQAHDAWRRRFAAYGAEFPGAAQEFSRMMHGELSIGWEETLPVFAADAKGLATRAASGNALNALAAPLPELIGGSADLAGSTKVALEGSGVFTAETPAERNIYFGIREHAMASIANGLALHGGLRPFCSTFLVFSDYMRPAIRLAALMRQPVIFIFTHDSIGLGEDGPTHQPIEQHAALRAIPNLAYIRPCDANETAEAWLFAIQNTEGPTALALTRQAVPTLDRIKYAAAAGLHRGAYILLDAPDGKPEIILMASGSEVWPTLQAGESLNEKGLPARVVSMPCLSLFEEQERAYRRHVLPPRVRKRVAVEAGISQGWHRYLGDRGAAVTIDGRFGASAPASELMYMFGFTAERILQTALAL